ncbi:hypothetical protein [Cystobacter ferrugineus]|nr:hypothetical protein [Cystobacter ferrugineus]
MSTVKDDPALTPGEQRILAVLGQGFQRMEQRQQALENKLEAQSKQLVELTARVSQEAAASKQRDRQLSADIQHLREEGATRDLHWHSTLQREMNAFRIEVSGKFSHHNTRLEMLELSIGRTNLGLQQLDQRLHQLQKEHLRLGDLIEQASASHTVLEEPSLTS